MSVGSQPSVADVGASHKHVQSSAGAATLGVCHIASGDRWAGAEVQLAALLKGLRQVPDIKLFAIFLNEGRLASEARTLGIDVCVFDESKEGFFRILSAARRYLAGKNVQILHSHRYKENLLAAFLARQSHVPVHVSSYHGAPEPFHGWRVLKQKLIQLLDRGVALSATDSIISVSDELRSQLVHKISEEKIVTIHNGIDADVVCSRFTPAEAKQHLGIAADNPVIGTAGRLDRIKRLDILLNAAKKIVTELPHTKFVIAGDGTEAAHLRQMAANLGLGERILFLGHRDDIYDVIRAMDIFVFCSDHEGLPMALLETLYLGVPVVARPVGGITEVIEDGVSGVYVRSASSEALASACTALLRDQKRRVMLRRAGIEVVVTKFTARSAAEQTAALYRSLSAAA